MLDVEYAKFKDDTIKDIREDEEQYAQLQEEIQALEAEIEAETKTRTRTLSDAPTPTVSKQPVEAFQSLQVESATSNTPQLAEPALATPTQVGTPIAQPQPLPQPPRVTNDRPYPPPSPQRNDYVPVFEQQGFVAGQLPHNARTLPHLPGLSPVHPPPDLHAANRRTPLGPAPGHSSPLPYPPQQHAQYQQYAPYNHSQSPWPPQPYPPSHSPHSGTVFYQNGPLHQGMIPGSTSILPRFQHYPQSAPVNQYNRGQQQSWQVPMPHPAHVQQFSAGSTPAQHTDGHLSRSWPPSSSTPWKRKRSKTAGLRVPSPEPPRDVSPFSDVEPPDPSAETKLDNARVKAQPEKQEDASRASLKSRVIRRARAVSTASSTVDRSSRSQSLASFTSDSRQDTGNRSRGARRIKPEPTSTPAPIPSDSEAQRSSERRRTRGDTLTSHDAPSRLGLKRKRGSIQDSSPLPSSVPHQQTRRQRPPQDTNLVSVSKTFNRVASQLLQRVSEHKFASIFAKPLSERDAPGYKSLIHRPQDLKSIKAAVTKGSKAAITAMEEQEQESGETPTLVMKTEDLVPPKGIVNMDQLEKELIRMFANAVMFNPLPDVERGLSLRRSLRLSATMNQDGETGYPGSEEDGIVQDARKMCEDVVVLIDTFKVAEQDRMEMGQS